MIVLLGRNMIIGFLLVIEIVLDRIANLNNGTSSCLKGFFEFFLDFAKLKNQVIVRVQKLIVTSVQKRLYRPHVIRHEGLDINLEVLILLLVDF